MKIKVAELEGRALDWAVAKAVGLNPNMDFAAPRRWGLHPGWREGDGFGKPIQSYSDWSQAGPILDREDILCGPSPFPGAPFAAAIGCDWDSGQFCMFGASRLQAAMRCFVRSRMGEWVDVPDELVAHNHRDAGGPHTEAQQAHQRPRSGG